MNGFDEVAFVGYAAATRGANRGTYDAGGQSHVVLIVGWSRVSIAVDSYTYIYSSTTTHRFLFPASHSKEPTSIPLQLLYHQTQSCSALVSRPRFTRPVHVADKFVGESQDAYNQAYSDDQPNESSLGHEVIAGGASFAAFKMFEDRQRKEGKTFPRAFAQKTITNDTLLGKPVSHQFAKELLAGFAGAEVDKLAETKGMDFADRERAKHQAKRNSEELYDQHYGQYDQYDPNQMGPPEHVQNQWGGGNGW